MRRKFKAGYAFSEHIHTEKKFFFDPRQNGYHEKRIAMRPVMLLLCILFVIIPLIGRLFYLQVIQGQHYRIISDTNRFRTTVIHAPRGIIVDRNGKQLVFNTPGFRETINGKTQVLSQAEAIPLLAKGDTHLEVDNLRNYPQKEILGHVLGYTGEVSADQLQQPEFGQYHSGDLIGKMGIEAQYESMLKGTDGKKLTEVDATGKTVQTMGQADPVSGGTIQLTIDSALQQKVFDAMKGIQKGAAIVSTPKGEILSLVSKPSFDPNLFTLGKNYQGSGDFKTVSDVLTATSGQPLLDRAISGTYPPGSTFKLVVGSAALEDHVIDKNFTIQDNGVLKIGNFSFSNWFYTQYGKTEGTVDIVKAIQRSNDIFFYTLGEKLGVDRLSAFARQFGLGSRLGIDLPGEAKGLVPTKEWKRKIIGEDWFTGDDYHYGIGQGYLLTTPLQVNMWTEAIANEGVLYKPHLLKNFKLPISNNKLLTTNNFHLIREGMIAACSPGGVAWPLFNFKFSTQRDPASGQMSNVKYPIDGKDFFIPHDATNSADLKNTIGVSIACKTGTAQHGNDQTLPHAWITLFAPAYHPQIIVTVLAEDSGEGSNIAGPVAKDIVTAWFER